LLSHDLQVHLRRLAPVLPFETATLWGGVQIIPSHGHGDIGLVTDELQGGIKPPPASTRNQYLSALYCMQQGQRRIIAWQPQPAAPY
jgi:hypothetical protein